MSMRKALAYLDGGPADGTLVETDEPEWAPLATLRVDVGGVEVIYVKAQQETPEPGTAWRYVPRGARQEYRADDRGVGPDPSDD